MVPSMNTASNFLAASLDNPDPFLKHLGVLQDPAKKMCIYIYDDHTLFGKPAPNPVLDPKFKNEDKSWVQAKHGEMDRNVADGNAGFGGFSPMRLYVAPVRCMKLPWLYEGFLKVFMTIFSRFCDGSMYAF